MHVLLKEHDTPRKTKNHRMYLPSEHRNVLFVYS